MQKRAEIRQIVKVVKSAMKEKGLSYKDLAKELGVSYPTIRRQMTTDDISLAKLMLICDWLHISLFELIDRVKRETASVYQFPKEHEKFFAQNTNYLAFLYALLAGESVSEIKEKHHLSSKCINVYLSVLEKMDLIERWPDDQVKVKIDSNVIVSDDRGPLGQVHSKHFIESLAKRAVEQLQHPQELRTYIGTRKLGPSEYEMLTDEIEEIVEKYRSISTINRSKDEAREVSFLFITDFWQDPFYKKIPKIED